MHTVLDMRSFLPNFVIVRSARDSDPKTAWEQCADMKDGESVVLDKAYVDFRHLETLDGRGVSWVTRPKENMLHEVVGLHAGGKWTPTGDDASPAPVAGTEAAISGEVAEQQAS